MQGIEDWPAVIGLARFLAVGVREVLEARLAGVILERLGIIPDVVDGRPVLRSGLHLTVPQHVVDGRRTLDDGFEVDVHLAHQAAQAQHGHGGLKLQSFLAEAFQQARVPVHGMGGPSRVLLAVPAHHHVEGVAWFASGRVLRTVVPDHRVDQQALPRVAHKRHQVVHPLFAAHGAFAGARSAGVLILDAQFASRARCHAGDRRSRRKFVQFVHVETGDGCGLVLAPSEKGYA